MTEQQEYLASLPRKHMAVGVVFRDAQDRILLVEPTYRDHWQLPGGVVEADESPATAAVREVSEELGITPPIGRPLVLRWRPPTADDPHGIVVIDYDGGQLDGETIARIRVPADELHQSRFFPDDGIAAHASSGTTSRIRAARRALAEGGLVQLEGDELRG